MRSELRYHQELKRADARFILSITHNCFGDSDSLSTVQKMFFKRSQKTDDTLNEYSLLLMQLHDKVKKRPLETVIISCDDKILKDKFTEEVKDEPP